MTEMTFTPVPFVNGKSGDAKFAPLLTACGVNAVLIRNGIGIIMLVYIVPASAFIFQSLLVSLSVDGFYAWMGLKILLSRFPQFAGFSSLQIPLSVITIQLSFFALPVLLFLSAIRMFQSVISYALSSLLSMCLCILGCSLKYFLSIFSVVFSSRAQLTLKAIITRGPILIRRWKYILALLAEPVCTIVTKERSAFLSAEHVLVLFNARWFPEDECAA